MTGATHTPDWSVSAVRVKMDRQKWLRIIDGISGEKPREVAFVPFGDYRPEDYRLCMSEARLIAAAPELLEALVAFAEGIQRLPVSWETGCCCCGSPVESHGLGDGHAPVDEGSHFVGGLIQQAEGAIRKATGAPT